MIIVPYDIQDVLYNTYMRMYATGIWNFTGEFRQSMYISIGRMK